jgi:hypothetical protein
MSVTTATELWRLSATDLAEAIRTKQTSSQEVQVLVSVPVSGWAEPD